MVSAEDRLISGWTLYQSFLLGFALCLVVSLCVGSLNAACCKDGETKADEDDCTKYLTCCHGEFVSKSCESGEYWDSYWELCVEDNGECKPPTCEDGEIEANPDDCAGYLECVNLDVVILTCPEGDYFNVTQKKCLPDTCGVCVKDGVLLKDYDSNGFLVCQCQCPIPMPCPDGLEFNESTQVCDRVGKNASASVSSADICPDNLVYNATADQCDYPANYVPDVACNTTITVCQNQPEGELFPVEGKCNMFYKCNFNCAVEQYCSNNLIYNEDTEKCDYPQNYKCKWDYSPPTGPDAGPSGIACQSNGRCLGQAEGTFFRSTKSCGNYVVCQCECETEMECPDGLYWDQDLQTCNYEYDVACTL